MTLANELANLGVDEAVKAAKAAANRNNLSWNVGIETVFREVASNSTVVPGNVKPSPKLGITAIEKWVIKYWKGYAGRPSQRESNPPGTIPDPIVDTIIQSRLTHLDEHDIEQIKYAHRLGMSAENILGLILEEYLAGKLLPAGWHCAWGETVKSIDFVHEDGELLQVKNRSNSENSSSARVRDGTPIQKWHRVDANTGVYKWNELSARTGVNSLSEEDFQGYVKGLLENNPKAMAVEDGNSWDED